MSDNTAILNKLSNSLAEIDVARFCLGLKDVVEHQGGVGKIASDCGLNRESLYKTLSGERDPRLSTILHIISGIGVKIKLEVDPEYLEREFAGIPGFERPWIDIYLMTPSERLAHADRAIESFNYFSTIRNDASK